VVVARDPSGLLLLGLGPPRAAPGVPDPAVRVHTGPVRDPQALRVALAPGDALRVLDARSLVPARFYSRFFTFGKGIVRPEPALPISH